MKSSTSLIGSLIGHVSCLALLVGLASTRSCAQKFPEPLGGFTMVELGGGEAPSEPSPSTPAPAPEQPNLKEPAPPPAVPDPEAIKLPEPEKKKPPPPKEPVKKPDPPKPPEKKPDPPKKPDPVKKPVKPAEPKRDLVQELKDRLKNPVTTPTGKVFGPVGPTTSTGSGGTSGNTIGSATGSAAVAKVEDELYRKLYAIWDQPRGVSSFMTTDVFIKIAPNGIITESTLAKASGDEVMDQSVLAAVRAVRAVAPLPRELKGGYETTFRFRVKN